MVHFELDEASEEEVAAAIPSQGEAENLLKLARARVAYVDETLQQAVRDVQALDGVVGLIAMLTFSKEQKIERALAEVKRLRVELARAKQAAIEAEGVLEASKAATRSAAEAEVEEVMRLELIADDLRAVPGEQADWLIAKEQKIEEHRLLLGLVDGLLKSSHGVLGASGTLARKLEGVARARRHSRHGRRVSLLDDVVGDVVGDVVMSHWTGSDGAELRERLEAYRQACRLLDAELELSSEASQVLNISVGSFEDMLPSEREIATLLSGSVDRRQSGIQDLRDMVRQVGTFVGPRRKSLADRVEALESERRSFLRRAAP